MSSAVEPVNQYTLIYTKKSKTKNTHQDETHEIVTIEDIINSDFMY